MPRLRKAKQAPAPKPIEIELEVDDAPPSMPEKPATGTAEWLRDRRAKARAARPKGPLSEAEKERQRAKWAENKDRYNQQRRERTAEARVALGEKPRGRGRPPKPAVNEAPGDLNDEDMANFDQAPTGVPVSTIEVPEQPPWLRTFLGDELNIPAKQSELPAYHISEWQNLATKTTQPQYIRNVKRVLRTAGEDPPDTMDPYVLGQFMVDRKPNIFDLIAGVTHPEYIGERGAKANVNTLNGFSAALLAVCSAILRRYASQSKTTGRDWIWLVQANVAFQAFNGHFKQAANAKHQSQELSAASKGKIVPWAEWVTKAKAFVKKSCTAKASFDQWKKGMLVACYTYIPPVRLAWRDVKVVSVKPAKGSRENGLLVTPTGMTSYWGDFKNDKSFSKELPVEHPIQSKEFVALMRKYLAMLKSPYLFPKKNEPDSGPVVEGTFGKWLADTNESITGKRFSSTPLRISFLTAWHDKNSKNGTNLKKLKEVMHQVLQTNIATSLAYNKVNADDLYAKLLKEIEAEDD
jgi:hypothetical protein